MKAPITTKVFFVLFLFQASAMFGQSINLRVQHITTENGLSQNTVDCILKDSRGFMWFGTWNGLNRFDGYTFNIYKAENSPRGLSSNFIYALSEDHNGNIWIGTRNGLNVLNYTKGSVVQFFHDNNPNSISGNSIKALYCDASGFLWVGSTDNGLDKFEIEHESLNLKKVKHYSPTELQTAQVNVITQLKNGEILVGTNKGLVGIDSKENITSISRNSAEYNSLSHNDILSIFEDSRGTLWIGTMFGLNRCPQFPDKFDRYYQNPDYTPGLSHSVVTSISEDPNGRIIVGNLGGLDFYHPETNNFEHFPVNTIAEFSLNNKFINTVYPDHQGNIWIGTDKGGINKFNIYQKQFYYIGYDQFNSNSLSHPTVNSIMDEGTNLWIGTAGGGLNCYNKKTQRYTHFRHSSHNNLSISSDFVTTIVRDPSGNLLLGTWGGGINKMSASGAFEQYLPTGKADDIRDPFVSSMLVTKSDPFIVVGTQNGLDLFYPSQKKFKRIASADKLTKKISEVGCLLKDRRGDYWIGTRVGLYRIKKGKIETNLTDNDIEYYTYNPNTQSIAGNFVISLAESKDGSIWAGTYGNGFSKITPKGDTFAFENFNHDNGLCNNVVYAIVEDNYHRLWLSTDNGLAAFNQRNKTFVNYYISDGLQGNQFYWSSASQASDGTIYFGGINGVNYFHPEKINTSNYAPRIVITDLKVFNAPVEPNSEINGRNILSQSIDQTLKLRLSYRENVFALEFAALDYYLPEKIQYAYKLEGVDKDWVYVPSSRRFAGYTNLKGGEYTFLVKSSNNDGQWVNEPTKLIIKITPPFWETAWFIIGTILIIIISIFYYFQHRTRLLQKRKRELERIVKERTSKIEEQKEELQSHTDELAHKNIQLANRQEQIEKQKEILEEQNSEISQQRDKLIELNRKVQQANQYRLRFFTNISHEFRTPLTLILGPLEKLLSDNDLQEGHRESMKLINRNAQRLLHLINQLMEFRKIETGKMSLKVSEVNVNQFIVAIFDSFGELAQRRKIKYSFSPLDKSENDWFDREKIENVVYNLLSNAFKYTADGGSISLSLNYIHSLDNNRPMLRGLEIKVSDNGKGIPSDQIGNIFKRFFRVDTPDNVHIKGSGIGLSLSRELVKAHSGTISVDSVLGMGSTFSVIIPVAKSDYKPEDIAEITSEIINQMPSELIADDLESSENTGSKISSSNKTTILVAEDNSDLRSFISIGLQDEYNVLEAENGLQALQMASAHTPNLIISDIMMPEMDGLELCSRLKDNLATSHIPVVLLTARSSVENLIEGLETGADDYIAKPFNFQVLKARIANLIENRLRLRRSFVNEPQIEPTQLTTTPADEQFLKKAFKIVEENFENPEFGVEDFIEKMGVSRSLLHKKLTALTDQSAGDFITSLRLKKSAQLLKSGSCNISEAAWQTGFNDPKYYTRLFRKHFGITPSEYISANK